ncbi:MAG: hypothetical protein JKY51_00205, partial [Opitutaceae bacterium]|nr:hypothetical protein [Opitutaceae bacterium]
ASDKEKKNLRTTLVIFLLITALAVLHFKCAPLPLKPYMGTFYIAFPLFLMAVSISGIIDFLEKIKNRRALSTCIKASLLLIPFILWRFSTTCPIPSKNIETGQLSDAIITQAQIKNQRNITIDYSEHDLWSITAGVLLELHKRNIRARTVKAHMDFLFTPLAVKRGIIYADIRIVKAEDSDGNSILKTTHYALDKGPDFNLSERGFISIGFKNGFNAKELLFVGWAEAEETHRWNTNKVADIQFAVKEIAGLKGKLTFELISNREQEIIASLNGSPIGHQKFQSKKGQLIHFPFEPSLLKERTVNILHFNFPLARQPRNTDSRLL